MSMMATALLSSNGKLQFWQVVGSQLWSAWKSSDDPNASWIGWVLARKNYLTPARPAQGITP